MNMEYDGVAQSYKTPNDESWCSLDHLTGSLRQISLQDSQEIFELDE